MKIMTTLRNGAVKVRQAIEEVAFCVFLCWVWYKVRRLRIRTQRAVAGFARQGV